MNRAPFLFWRSLHEIVAGFSILASSGFGRSRRFHLQHVLRRRCNFAAEGRFRQSGAGSHLQSRDARTLEAVHRRDQTARPKTKTASIDLRCISGFLGCVDFRACFCKRRWWRIPRTRVGYGDVSTGVTSVPSGAKAKCRSQVLGTARPLACAGWNFQLRAASRARLAK